MTLNDSTKALALVLESMGLKYCPKLRDIICGRPQIKQHCVQISRTKQRKGNLVPTTVNE